MTDTLYVSLGKTGDIITLLPVFRHKAKDGPVPVMVSKDHASVFDGVSYVKPVVFNGGAHELEQACKEASKLASKVVVAQVCGPMDQVRKYVLNQRPETKDGKFRGDSFQKSLWDCLGHWADFNKGWPLVFDKRDAAREQALKEKYLTEGERLKKQNRPKLILVSTGRQPGKKPKPDAFKYKSLLMLVLKLAFKKGSGGGYRVIDLDEIVADRIYDLIALYEEAHCLIATDNAPLHLGQGVPTLPICCLCADRPTMWNGSAWRTNHLYHCRYSDFPERVSELVMAIETIHSSASFFWQKKVQGPKKIHVWSQYEVSPENEARHRQAAQTWQQRYQADGNWISCKVDRGAFGRDNETNGLQGGRYPYVKDVLRLATQRAKPDDSIVLTRADTCFADKPIPNGYCYRTLRTKDGDNFAPWIDLISVPHGTMDRLGELPDLVMGPDQHWSEVVARWAGVPELEDVVFRSE